ncbi:ATP-binding cassette domain-containing protein [Liberiplasma polymorphum]|uniref:ATP-binding cassette domain-containing protein n=1 Tax=Liberiplasma polymorphum TaxID=3374570 RepID=UPI003774731A
MITVKHLSKSYGTVHAVKSISFQVKESAFFALLGPNGAGKSTTIEIISTLLSHDEGSVNVNGYTLGREDEAIRNSIGVVFQYSTLDARLSVQENLRVRASFYKMDKETFKERYEALREKIQFGDYEHQRVETLSGGQ